MPKKITVPLDENTITNLKAGDKILLSGIIYTARDVAHQNLCDLISNDKKLPFELENQVIYFTGPSPTKPGQIIGSAGPTTSYRMDAFSPLLIMHGIKGMIGKGRRSQEVINAMKKHRALYFAAVGGAGALLAEHIKSCEIVAFPELGPEAIHKLYVEDFPVIVAIDAHGNSLYAS